MQSNFLEGFPNVIYDPNSCPELSYLDIREYISDIIIELKDKLSNKFDDYCFLIFSTNSDGRIPTSIDQEFPGKKKVLVYLLDEAGLKVDDLGDKYHYIFKQYLPSESNNNIYSLPLGHVNGVRFEDSRIPPVKDRKVNVFFSGSLNKNRTDFYNQFSAFSIPSTNTVKKMIKFSFIRKKGRYIKKILTKYKKKEILPNSFINITGGFKQGLSKEAYMEYLLNSKIAFCPSGASCVETYRHFEAMSAGCVIISDKLPDISIYKECPIIQVENWKEGIETAKRLLDRPKELQELQEATTRFWEDHYSPRSVAAYIINKIAIPSKATQSE